MTSAWIWNILPFLSGYIFASFGVYWIHRLMHFGKVYAKTHIDHHKQNTAQGWLNEFWDYLAPGSVVILLGAGFWFIHSWQASVEWIFGEVLCLAFNAFIHEVSHTNPNLIFWTKPVHYFHHYNKQWKHNFGFSTVIWDHLFGTFKDDPNWKREKVSYRDFFKVRWL